MEEIKHDWRRNPNGNFRVNSDDSTSYMLACTNCEARGWGKQQNEVVRWPAWHGEVEIDSPDCS